MSITAQLTGQKSLQATMEEKENLSGTVTQSSSGGTADHSRLTNRDAADQHPITAITGLRDELDSKLGEEYLDAAVYDALAKAKESGEFTGEKGDPGQDGAPGADGKDGVSVTHSWNGTVLTGTSASGTSAADLKGEKGEPGADGAKGDPGDKGEKGEKGDPGQDGSHGTDGKDGVSVTHSWNGTVLTVTSASGTSSADLKGDKGDPGSDGADGSKGDKGDPGDPGADGHTPGKGTDYFTESEVTKITEDAKSAVLENLLTIVQHSTYVRSITIRNICIVFGISDVVYGTTPLVVNLPYEFSSFSANISPYYADYGVGFHWQMTTASSFTITQSTTHNLQYSYVLVGILA